MIESQRIQQETENQLPSETPDTLINRAKTLKQNIITKTKTNGVAICEPYPICSKIEHSGKFKTTFSEPTNQSLPCFRGAIK